MNKRFPFVTLECYQVINQNITGRRRCRDLMLTAARAAEIAALPGYIVRKL